MHQYIDKINSLIDPTFQQIRAIANERLIHLTNDEHAKLWEQLNHGINLLDSHELMCQYLWSFGNMHEAKIKKGLSCFTIEAFTNDFDIVDWGCGQGLATVCFLDFLKNLKMQNQVHNVTLIEPSPMALKRATLHVDAYLKDLERIKPIQKYLNDVTSEDIQSGGVRPVFHFFSNILDIKEIDLKELAVRLNLSILNDNYVVCVGPLNSGNQRIDAFYNHFNTPEIYIDEKVSQYFYGGNTSCSYNIKVYKLSADREGIIIPIEYYPSVQFHAGYRLDCIKEGFANLENPEQEKVALLYKSLTSFETSAPFDIGASVYDDIHPILAVLNNIITRGLPTKASPFIERVFEKAFGYSTEKNESGVISFDKQQIINDIDDLFLAMHIIDSRLILDETNYNLGILDSDLEKEFITKIAHKSLRQILQPQRSLSSITKITTHNELILQSNFRIQQMME